ncbi:beta-glucosidase [Steroidobacter agaridevorans]|uniref:Beta-glucosidase n=2 Tax=Steroidobacter agaridevorans TaxID=2695856 RepID=A0A829YHY2_9GAMM|nr:beta-glucosidase [Steroidobacter agaridevorans]
MMIDRRTLIAASVALAASPWANAASKRFDPAFPKGFLWGAATSGHQIEGNNVNADIWVVENVKPTIYAEKSADAANSFELWPQDLDLVKQIGLNTYRFSLEWSRIEPEEGMFSIAALDHYKRIIDGCRERGITPVVTFNHYTTPRWFAARGGWTKQDAPQLFARFCDQAARRLAEGIGYATTLNEPNLIAVLRYAALAEQLDKLLPYIRAMNEAAARAVGSEQFVTGNSISVDDVDGLTRTMIAGHKAGREAIKAVRPNLPVGVSLAIVDDQAVGRNSIRDSMRTKLYGAWLEAVRGDDFLGVQNYERHLWDAKGTVEPPPGDRNAAGGEVYPAALAGAVRHAHSVTKVPIIVTEHGVNTEDDALRARLIPAALTELKKTMDEGVPVLGYFHWSLIDNFEWLYGYKPKYGLASVDRTTFKRTLKPSAQVYGAIARRNAL